MGISVVQSTSRFQSAGDTSMLETKPNVGIMMREAGGILRHGDIRPPWLNLHSSPRPHQHTFEHYHTEDEMVYSKGSALY